ncbi:Unknown protein [Striga hermonthica]|uniref:Reverse transcriptase zinc-binding domain-containing protein n=1 Tax=Striga hermonthica TaxID=68872 RepID=A0A9N7N6D4_STRHE|nr:Unknown protein [Striga hermonthica]
MQQITKVSDLFAVDGLSWNTDLVRQLFSPSVASQILNLHISQRGHPNKLIWKTHKKSIFSVKEAYKAIRDKNKSVAGGVGTSRGRESTLKIIWRKTWHLPIKPKIRNFLWKCWHNWLGTNSNLHRRGAIVDLMCCWCGETEENLEHMLFLCPRAKLVWKLAGIWWHKMQSDNMCFRDWWEDLCNLSGSAANKERISLSTYLLWWLSRTRNSWIFNKEHMSELMVVEGARREWLEFEATNDLLREGSRKQGVGVHSIDLSASATCQTTWKIRGIATPRGDAGRIHWFVYKNPTASCQTEDSLVQIRQWLSQGVDKHWLKEEIFIKDESLRCKLAQQMPFPWHLDILAMDIHSLSLEFQSISFPNLSDVVI